MIFKGIGTAIVTPFDENNNINYTKLKELIEFQIRNEIEAIVVCGTTGESSTLSLQEKREVIKFTVDSVNGRTKVIAGTGSNCTEYAIELSKYAQNVGVDGVLVVTPYYNKCNQEGLYTHFKNIADSIKIPVILYNVPTRTCVNLEPTTAIELSKIDNIVGLKQANPNLDESIEIFSKVNPGFCVYAGNDDLLLPMLSIGAVGGICVISNIIPKQTKLITDSFFNNDLQLAKDTQLKYYDLMKAMFKDVNPISVKECMNLLDFNVGDVRLPLSKTSENNLKYFKTILKEYNLL